MKTCPWICWLAVMVGLFSCQRGEHNKTPYAEDLWGERLDVRDEIASGRLVAMVPFSTSNCGYCLIDGYFVEENYIGNCERSGGKGYHLCLFNPQLDVYSFQKHFRWESPILTFPPSLHQYHEDGFPTLLAFKGGKQVLREFYNYAKFDTLRTLLWNADVRLRPTGNLHLASRFIYENDAFAAVKIYPDEVKIPDRDIESGIAWKAFHCKNFGQLAPEDLQKHLFISWTSNPALLKDFFRGINIPVKLGDKSFQLGEYGFNTDSASLVCCFPSPFNPEKFVVLQISGPDSKGGYPSNYLDYMVQSTRKATRPVRLLYGHFDKSNGNAWSFDESLCFSDTDPKAFCLNRCILPEKRSPQNLTLKGIKTSHKAGKGSQVWTLGSTGCRFPGLTTDADGDCWVTWEEEGNIALARIHPDGETQGWYVEHNESDSYNPLVASIQDEVWVFYLSKREEYYWLYGKSFDGESFSGEILLNRKGPFDVVTPAVASDTGGEMTLAWCEWLANCRYLKYRILSRGGPGEIRDVPTAPSVYIEGYTNAWYPSLTYYNREVWGAWNQHYPASFGVFGGPLSDTARPVTRPAEKMDDWECGGYPDIFCDGKKLFVTWESNAWDVYYNNEPQKIKLASYDLSSNQWTPGKIVTPEEKVVLCQTPDGTCDAKGNKFLVWSERDPLTNKPWEVRLIRESEGNWTEPVRISGKQENARYPKIVAGRKHDIWISWHSGIGKDMLVKVCRISGL
jgi:hypothetical protein